MAARLQAGKSSKKVARFQCRNEVIIRHEYFGQGLGTAMSPSPPPQERVRVRASPVRSHTRAKNPLDCWTNCPGFGSRKKFSRFSVIVVATLSHRAALRRNRDTFARQNVLARGRTAADSKLASLHSPEDLHMHVGSFSSCTDSCALLCLFLLYANSVPSPVAGERYGEGFILPPLASFRTHAAPCDGNCIIRSMMSTNGRLGLLVFIPKGFCPPAQRLAGGTTAYPGIVSVRIRLTPKALCPRVASEGCDPIAG